MTQSTGPHRLMASPDHPHDTRQRPASQREPEGPQRSLCEPTRAATALRLTPASGHKPHITVRISKSRPRWSPTSMPESKEIARTSCEQTLSMTGLRYRSVELTESVLPHIENKRWRRQSLAFRKAKPRYLKESCGATGLSFIQANKQWLLLQESCCQVTLGNLSLHQKAQALEISRVRRVFNPHVL